MKKFLNTPESVVQEALAGMAAAHPALRVDPVARVVTRAAPTRPGKVALISGGGSGHEPLHAGFVGTGMLDAACPGEIFTSPVPDQMLTAAEAVHSDAGVLFIVKNYTGDVLNFGIAADLAADAGIATDTVVVDDDVAVQDLARSGGRRGTGATVFVEKLAGALAEQGAPLADVAELGRRVNAASRSFAVALTACTTPAMGRPGFDLPEDQMEVGVGIHGEPGRSRTGLRPAGEIARLLVETVLSDLPADGDRALVMLNGLGGTPLIELYLMFGEVAAELARRGVTVARSLVGNYLTSLDMAGVSLTVCRADRRLLELWDAPVHTPALRWGI